MYQLNEIPRDEFHAIAKIIGRAEERALWDLVADAVGLETRAREGQVFAVMYAKARFLATVAPRQEELVDISKIVEDAGLKFAERAYMLEALMSGFAGTLSLSSKTVLENLSRWWVGIEDIIVISEDFGSYIVLTHYHALLGGDLADTEFVDTHVLCDITHKMGRLPWKEGVISPDLG